MERAERARNQRQRVERARAAAGSRGSLFTPAARPAVGRLSPAPSSPGLAADEEGGATPLPAVTPGARWDGTHWYVGRTRPKSGLGQHANAAYRV